MGFALALPILRSGFKHKIIFSTINDAIHPINLVKFTCAITRH